MLCAVGSTRRLNWKYYTLQSLLHNQLFRVLLQWQIGVQLYCCTCTVNIFGGIQMQYQFICVLAEILAMLKLVCATGYRLYLATGVYFYVCKYQTLCDCVNVM